MCAGVVNEVLIFTPIFMRESRLDVREPAKQQMQILITCAFYVFLVANYIDCCECEWNYFKL